MTEHRRKLIEVALPLEAINRESAREKQPFTRNHPRSLHIWWARRPLVACRAVIFSQLVDDPSAHPDRFPTEASQEIERQRLFHLIERLVVWENSGDEALLAEAYAEILKSTDGHPPTVADPFAGGGSIPLEAQRLGLEAHASDLNPVAVLINRALIEIPPEWADMPPVFPGAASSQLGRWTKASGLAEDVRLYGDWMIELASLRIGDLYPTTVLSNGIRALVTAWIWARTVTCPNPACGIDMPLVRSFWLSKKKGPTWVKPSVTQGEVHFEVVYGKHGPIPEGTVGRNGATCIACQTPVDLKYVRERGRSVGLGTQLMAVIAEGDRQRHYLGPNAAQVEAANVKPPDSVLESDLPDKALGFRVQAYGLTQHRHLFTPRQLAALSTFSDLVGEARERVNEDAVAAGLPPSRAEDYGEAVALYLGLGVSRYADLSNSIASWNATNQNVRALFARQAVPMSWDFVEANPFGALGIRGSLATASRSAVARGIRVGTVEAADARLLDLQPGTVVCTDPPYYDNIGYADLSDFFYVWLRRSLGSIHTDDTATLLTPKAAELVATPHRFGGSRSQADRHFEEGFVETFARIGRGHSREFPMTLFYAFKQAESDESGTASTGWETMLKGLMSAGFMVTATWPMRTERAERSVGLSTNALASSVVLACRQRPKTAEATNRRTFIAALKHELPPALKHMQQGSVAPVDLAQAAIGPGMAVFSRYARVVEADGSDMTVRTALALINQVLDEVLTQQEGDFDSDTRFCVKWFSQFGWNETTSGEADVLTRATNTSVEGLVRAGVFRAVAGKARLVSPDEMAEGWDPATDDRLSDWQVAVRLAHALEDEGVVAASALMAAASQRVDMDTAKELAYLLYAVCEKRGWTESAILFNGLATSWSDISAEAHGSTGQSGGTQPTLDFDSEQ